MVVILIILSSTSLIITINTSSSRINYNSGYCSYSLALILFPPSSASAASVVLESSKSLLVEVAILLSRISNSLSSPLSSALIHSVCVCAVPRRERERERDYIIVCMCVCVCVCVCVSVVVGESCETPATSFWIICLTKKMCSLLPKE